MHRRTLLGTIGGLAVTATAGCMSAGGDSNDPTPDGDETPTDDPTPTVDQTPGDQPGSAGLPTGDSDGGIRPADGVTPEPIPVDLSGISCPTTREDADLRVCSTTTDLDDADIALVPPRPPLFEPTAGDEMVGVFEIELRNQSESTFGFNPYSWSLKRHTDDGWDHVAPEMTPEPWMQLAPGESYTYGLAVESVPTERTDGSRRIVQDLDSGIYALIVDGLLERSNGGERVECAAVFAVTRSED